MQIAALKLTDYARTFYNTCLELHAEDATWGNFKKAFREQFRDVHTDQYHFMGLQTARQAKHEGPQEFADRFRALAQKVMRKDSDSVAQRIHREKQTGCFWPVLWRAYQVKSGDRSNFKIPRTYAKP